MEPGGEGPVEEKPSLRGRLWRWGWTLPAGLALVGGAGFLVDVVWTAAGADRALRVDAARTTFTILIGLGGAVTLALLVHRQILAAAAHAHQVADAERRFKQAERVAADNLAHARNTAAATQHDAIQKRAQELFSKSVDQLGSEKAAVRVGALHALNDLGQEHPKRRRAVMDVWCSYLRMPPPRAEAAPRVVPAIGTEPVDTTAGGGKPEWPEEELHVRATAQRLITDHLRPHGKLRWKKNPKPAKEFWGAMDIDLTGAHLHDLNLTWCRLRYATFGNVTFTGQTSFGSTRISKPAWFAYASFEHASFLEATFCGNAFFVHTKFSGEASFRGATFSRRADFEGAMFEWDARFDQVHHVAAGSKPARILEVRNTVFADDVDFHGAMFGGTATFAGAQFVQLDEIDLSARVMRPDFDHIWPAGWRVGATDDGEGPPLERTPDVDLSGTEAPDPDTA